MLAALVLASAALWTGAQTAPEPAPAVTARIAQTEVSIGEPFVVELVASGPAGTTWTFPAEAGDDSVELKSAPPDPAASPGASPAAPAAGTWRYRASLFSVKDPAVPAVQVRYRLPDGRNGTVATAPVPLRLRSLLPKDPQSQTLADVRPPLALSIGWPFWAAVAGVVALLAALVWVWLRRRRGAAATAAPAAPALSAEQEARHALDLLERSGRLASGDWRGVYIALTEIAKRYLERRLAAPILEMTSSETLAYLRERAHGDDVLVPLRGLMSAADQVKFARGASQLEEARRHLAAVRALVAALEARLAAPTPAVSAPVAGAPAARPR
jgi:hypothetical protein